jgi:membrane associated rhomboid family serine protease
MIPLTVDVPMKRLPWANWGLILATVVISLAVPYTTSTSSLVTEGSLSSLVLQRRHFALHQLVTALFQHAGLVHLFGNMLFLFVFGNAINAKMGHLPYLGAYLGIGIAVNLAWLAIGAGPAVVGASGAIMGICGMFLVLYPRNEVDMFWGDNLIFAMMMRDWSGGLPGWGVVGLYIAFDIWGMVRSHYEAVSHLSHFVGAILGVGLAVVLLKTGWLEPDVGEHTLLQWMGGEGPVEREDRRKKRKKRKRKEPSA